MSDPSNHEITQLLAAWSKGDRQAEEPLMSAVYAELRRLAGIYLSKEIQGHSLQPTILVHEAYLRLTNQQHIRWQNRSHFFGIASQMMRRILVDHARARQASKRNGQEILVELDQVVGVIKSHGVDVLWLDETLNRLEAIDPRVKQIVELRVFGGFSVEEIAEVLNISVATVGREWRFAKTWLQRELS